MKKTLLAISILFSIALHAQTEIRQWDGPYVLYKGDDIAIHTVYREGDHFTAKTDNLPLSKKQDVKLIVGTDDPHTFFEVKLKNTITNEPPETRKASKQFILSDIEGNFGAFRKLLQAGGVIDSALHWSFGNGHLILNGDFFDRGDQVTEVLWLIYSLEEPAKAAGGYVHYILGNHEQMNISFDYRYHATKYASSAAVMQLSYDSLFGRHAELGRWLRSKNIVEKVGSNLFAHGGISADMNYLSMSLQEINALARPYYDDTTFQYKDPRLNFIYGDTGPMWYRGYYMTQPLASGSQVDSTLDHFGVSKIITGHSIMSDVITSWYGGHVLNTDVEHRKGNSEAILMDGKNYYRVKPGGERIAL